MIDKTKILEIRQDKQKLYEQVVRAGGTPKRRDTFLCPFHSDSSPSSWIKKSINGLYYFKCAVCGLHYDYFDLAALNKGISVQELFREEFGEVPQVEYKKYYKTVEELVEGLDAIAIEEINDYSNPDTGNLDLIVIRYLKRGESKKAFCQAYQTDSGFVKGRPAGLCPLFNRRRLKDSEEVLIVEGEKCVRELTRLGFIATCTSGGAANANASDFFPLAGKRVILWRDYDEPGQRYIEEAQEKLLALDPPCEVFLIDVEGLELPVGGDCVDLIEKVKAEGGTDQDCKDYIQSLIDDAGESNALSGVEDLLAEMREGLYANLEIKGFPILTDFAAIFLNKRLGIVYGGAGMGKSLLVSKWSDDFVLAGYKVARLQLEDELEQHVLRSFAQQAERVDIVNPRFHREHPDESHQLYDLYKPTLDILAKTIVSGEHSEWDETKVLDWVEYQLRLGKDLVIVDPISVISSSKIWLTMHRLAWKTKGLLAKYPNGRVLYVSHPNAEGTIAGGQALKRFAHTMLTLNRCQKPKKYLIANQDGEEEIITVEAILGIEKTRYGSGSGLDIAVRLNPQTLTMEEVGVMLEEIKEPKTYGGRGHGRDLEAENKDYDIKL